MKPTETQLEKIIKPKFYGVSNVELVRRINEAPDFGYHADRYSLESNR